MNEIQTEITLLESRLEHTFGKNSYESRVFRKIIDQLQGSHDLTHEEEICLALADAYDH
jgi:hypothetical protein